MAASTEARMQIGYRGRAAGLDKPITQKDRKLQTFQEQRKRAEEAAQKSAAEKRLELEVENLDAIPAATQALIKTYSHFQNVISQNKDISSADISSMENAIAQLSKTAEGETNQLREMYKDADLSNKYSYNINNETGEVEFIGGEDLNKTYIESVTNYDPEGVDFDNPGAILSSMSQNFYNAKLVLGSAKNIPDSPSSKELNEIVVKSFENLSEQFISSGVDITGEQLINTITKEMKKGDYDKIVASVAEEYSDYFEMQGIRSGEIEIDASDLAEGDPQALLRKKIADYATSRAEELLPRPMRRKFSTTNRSGTALGFDREDAEAISFEVVEVDDETRANLVQVTERELVSSFFNSWGDALEDLSSSELKEVAEGEAEDFTVTDETGEEVGFKAMYDDFTKKASQHLQLEQQAEFVVPFGENIPPMTVGGKQVRPISVVIDEDGNENMLFMEDKVVDVSKGKTEKGIVTGSTEKDVTESDRQKQKIKISIPGTVKWTSQKNKQFEIHLRDYQKKQGVSIENTNVQEIIDNWKQRIDLSGFNTGN